MKRTMAVAYTERLIGEQIACVSGIAAHSAATFSVMARQSDVNIAPNASLN
jgi:hypothetical protein